MNTKNLCLSILLSSISIPLLAAPTVTKNHFNGSFIEFGARLTACSEGVVYGTASVGSSNFFQYYGQDCFGNTFYGIGTIPDTSVKITANSATLVIDASAMKDAYIEGVTGLFNLTFKLNGSFSSHTTGQQQMTYSIGTGTVRNMMSGTWNVNEATGGGTIFGNPVSLEFGTVYSTKDMSLTFQKF